MVVGLRKETMSVEATPITLEQSYVNLKEQSAEITVRVAAGIFIEEGIDPKSVDAWLKRRLQWVTVIPDVPKENPDNLPVGDIGYL
jgi:hypothetical protein